MDEKSIEFEEFFLYLQQKVRKGDMLKMSEEELLQYILCHTVRCTDVKIIARNLLEKFKSLHEIYNASYASLTEVGGVSPTTATFLSSFPTLFGRYSVDGVDTSPILSTEELVRIMSIKFTGLRGEKLYAVMFDDNMHILQDTLISESTAGFVQFEYPQLLKTALKCDARNIILMHNHPNKNLRPSAEDIETTYKLIKVFKEFDIRLVDHVIVSSGEYWSMAKDIKLRHMFEYFTRR